MPRSREPRHSQHGVVTRPRRLLDHDLAQQTALSLYEGRRGAVTRARDHAALRMSLAKWGVVQDRCCLTPAGARPRAREGVESMRGHAVVRC